MLNLPMTLLGSPRRGTPAPTSTRRTRHPGQALAAGSLLAIQFLGALVVTVIALLALMVNVVVWLVRALMPGRPVKAPKQAAVGSGRRRQVFIGSS
ncbi:MAG: hypothetical protein R3343_12340 [Nitriliruptorales bacterium]|nr:hypothetical protein [Nitriliruptorales bacterium]